MKIWNHLLSLATIALVGACMSTVCLAEEESGNPAEASDADVAGPDYDALVKQLDSAKFSERQQAMRALEAAGPDAFGALERASQSDSREAILRSVEILKSKFENGSEEVKAAAKSSLEKIASTGKPAAAGRAKEALEPPAPEQQFFPGIPGGIQIGGGNIQIQIQGQAQAIGGNGKRVSMKNVNGDKEIEVVEGDRKVKINEAKSGEIKLEVTEKNKDGKEETKKYEAKNEEELKKNHPEAHKIFTENSQGGGNQIQFRAIQIQPGNMPRIQGIPFPGQIQPFGQRVKQAPLELQKRQLEKMQEQMKKVAEDTGNEGLKQAIEQLEEVRKQLEKSQAEIQAAEEKESESDDTEAESEESDS